MTEVIIKQIIIIDGKEYYVPLPITYSVQPYLQEECPRCSVQLGVGVRCNMDGPDKEFWCMWGKYHDNIVDDLLTQINNGEDSGYFS